jgi:hypothetical protein
MKRWVFAAGSVVALALLGGCVSSGGSPGETSSVEGEWLSTDGVAVSRLAGGLYESVAADTGNRLAHGVYRMDDPRTATITGETVAEQNPIAFNCALVAASQLNCTSTSGEQFVLTRRQATTS